MFVRSAAFAGPPVRAAVGPGGRVVVEGWGHSLMCCEGIGGLDQMGRGDAWERHSDEME